MSELIDQLRNLRAAAYRKLTQNSDFKVLMELDQMLARLDPGDTPMAPPETPEAGSPEKDDESDDDTEAAPPEPDAEPPPIAATAGGAATTLSRADESVPEATHAPDVTAEADDDGAASDDAEEDDTSGADVFAAQAGDDPAATSQAMADEESEVVDVESLPDVSGDVLAVNVEDTDETQEIGDDVLIGAEGDLADTASQETAKPAATSAASDLIPDEELDGDTDAATDADGSDTDQDADVFGSEESAAAAVAAALSITGEEQGSAPRPNHAREAAKPAPAPEPAPVALAPEEDYDAAAPSGETESSDAAYESALNRLNALIERASHRLKRDENEPNGASAL
ncbi:hypothetical protein ACKTEK_13400 [Tepidamorphus sp. 3E244]|uniref:hypothetical protein n=1 Tax=Tepidamorphus sp. 3E244 TaxID=3385498 RepID=UPI0038FC6123